MTMALRAFLSALCPDCNSVCRLRCEKSWRVPVVNLHFKPGPAFNRKNRFFRCIMK